MAGVDPERLDKSEGDRYAGASERDNDAGSGRKLCQIHDHYDDLRKRGKRRLDDFHVQDEARPVVTRQDHGQNIHADR